MTNNDGPMSGDPGAELGETGDADLIARTRDGDRAAFGELWRRHYRSGITVARSVTSTLDPDDLVQEAYARIYQSILKGGGPTGSFRAYLFTSIRNTAAGWGRARRETTIDELESVEDPATSEQAAEDALDRSLTVQAYRSLPTRWQEVLWYSEIERMKPADIAPLLGMKAAAVSQLAFRAREGLREAWIQAHLRSVGDGSDHAWTIERLGAFARNNLGPRDTAKLEKHLLECTRCTIVAAEAKDVGGRLALVLLPLTVGISGTAAYLAALQTAAPTIAVAAMPSSVVDRAVIAGGSGTAGAAGVGSGAASGTGGAGAAAGAAVGTAAAGTAGGGILSGFGALIGIAAVGVVVAGAVVAAAVVPGLMGPGATPGAPAMVQPADGGDDTPIAGGPIVLPSVEPSETPTPEPTDPEPDSDVDIAPPPRTQRPTAPPVEPTTPPVPEVPAEPEPEEPGPEEPTGPEVPEEPEPGGPEEPEPGGPGAEEPTDPEAPEEPTDPEEPGTEEPTEPEPPTAPEGVPAVAAVHSYLELVGFTMVVQVEGTPGITVVVKIDGEDRASTELNADGVGTLTFAVSDTEWLTSGMQFFYRADGVDGEPLGAETDTPLFWSLQPWDFG